MNGWGILLRVCLFIGAALTGMISALGLVDLLVLHQMTFAQGFLGLASGIIGLIVMLIYAERMFAEEEGE